MLKMLNLNSILDFVLKLLEKVGLLLTGYIYAKNKEKIKSLEYSNGVYKEKEKVRKEVESLSDEEAYSELTNYHNNSK